MRYLFFVICLCWGPLTAAVEWEDRQLFSGARGTQTLRVISSTDISVFAPIIEGFLSANPALKIDYLVAGSADVYDEFRRSPEQFDVCLLYTSPSPRDLSTSRMPSSA